MHKVFLDTNVILDFLDRKRPRHEAAKALFRHLILHEYEIAISEDMISTIFYIDRDSDRVLKFYRDIVLKKWHLLAFGHETIHSAVALALQERADLEDLLQCLCAKTNHCSVFITNDQKFYHCGIAISSVEAFLKGQEGQ